MGAGRGVGHERLDGVGAVPGRRHPGRLQHQRAQPGGHRLAVQDPDVGVAALGADPVGGLNRRLHRGRDRRRQVDAQHRLAAGVQEEVDECVDLATRQLVDGRHPPVEVLDRDLLAVHELVGPETDEQRDDLDVEPVEFLVAQIA